MNKLTCHSFFFHLDIGTYTISIDTSPMNAHPVAFLVMAPYYSLSGYQCLGEQIASIINASLQGMEKNI
jgi:hypothetical protein